MLNYTELIKSFTQKDYEEKKVNLHIHTVCSDGQATPSEIIKQAQEKGYKYVSISDHNTLSAYFSNEISRRLEGTSLKIIKIEYLKEMELNIPDYEKQKSIGEYFNLMNQRNMLLERKIELNKEFENKVMADILKSR
jgi:histidinol phosphatase-like PHP family hydrolase